MRKIVLASALMLPVFAGAEELALNFNGMPLVQFVQSTYRAMLKRDYVMSPDLMAMEKPISVSVRSVKSEDLPQFVDSVLAAQGIRSEVKNGIYYLSLAGCDGGGCSSSVGRSGIALSGEVHGPYAVDAYRGSIRDVLPRVGDAPVLGGASMDRPDFERLVYRPQTRRSDFIASVINAAFLTKPASVAAGVVVLTGQASELEKMKKLAQQVDEAAHKVKLSATFVEVSSNESSGLGVSLIAQVLGARLGVKLGDASAGSLTVSAGGFQAVIDALAADGRFKQVAAPTAVVDDYEKSNLSFGDSVPTIASTSLDRNGTPVQQVQYQQSGVLLNVQPVVLGNGKINVVVDGQVSSFSATSTGVSGSPTLSKRQVQTTVTLDDGELLLIGGLNNNKSVSNRAGLSFLPKSWSAYSDSNTNTDLVLILSATVMQ